jgi:hypothetical protein
MSFFAKDTFESGFYCYSITGFIRGILRGVRYAKSLRVLFSHRRSPSWTTLVLYSRVVFFFNEPSIYVLHISILYSTVRPTCLCMCSCVQYILHCILTKCDWRDLTEENVGQLCVSCPYITNGRNSWELFEIPGMTLSNKNFLNFSEFFFYFPEPGTRYSKQVLSTF